MRIRAWLATVSDSEVRALDQQLILDLLKIETRPDAWAGVLDTAITSIDQLVLVGDLPLASRLLEAVVAIANDGSSPFAASATAGVTKLVEGPMVRHLSLFLQKATDAEFEIAKKMCTDIGPSLVKPMSDALMGEDNARIVRRLRDILVSFGPAAREYANELKSSRNPAVRRAAIDLLRGLAGDAALPDLRQMLDDPDSQVQREALRAIVQVGTAEAYQMLEQALKSGAAHTRDAIMQALGAFRDEKAAPLFLHMLANTDYKGAHEGRLHADHRVARQGGARRSLGLDAEGHSLPRRMVGARTHGAHPHHRGARAPQHGHTGRRSRPRGSGQFGPGRGAQDRESGARRARAAAAEEGIVDQVARLRIADDFVRRLAAALRAGQLYAPSHPLVQRAFDSLNEALQQMLTDQQTIAIGIIGQEIIVGDVPLPRAAESMGEMIRRLKSLGIERIAFDRGVTPDEVQTLALTIAHPERRPGQSAPGVEPADPLGVLNSLPHIRVGRIQTERRRRRRPRTSPRFAASIRMPPTSPARCGKSRKPKARRIRKRRAPSSIRWRRRYPRTARR